MRSLWTSMRSGTGQLSPMIEPTSSWTKASGSNPTVFIANGPNVSNLRSFTRSMIVPFQKTSRQKHDAYHAPDREKSVTDSIRNGITQSRYLALAHIADQAE